MFGQWNDLDLFGEVDVTFGPLSSYPLPPAPDAGAPPGVLPLCRSLIHRRRRKDFGVSVPVWRCECAAFRGRCLPFCCC